MLMCKLNNVRADYVGTFVGEWSLIFENMYLAEIHGSNSKFILHCHYLNLFYILII